ATGAPKSCIRRMLATQPARRNSNSPSPSRSPLPNSDSEFRHRVDVTYSVRQTCYSTLPLDPRTGDSGSRQPREGIRSEQRPPGRQDDDDRFTKNDPRVSHPVTLGDLGAMGVIIFSPGGSEFGVSIPCQRRIHLLLPAQDSARQVGDPPESCVRQMGRGSSTPAAPFAVDHDLTIPIDRLHDAPQPPPPHQPPP